MFYVVKNETEILSTFKTMLDARVFIETHYDFTDLGNYTYVVGNDVLEIYSE